MNGEDEKKVQNMMNDGEPKTHKEGFTKVRRFFMKKGKMITALSASVVFATTMMIGATACNRNKGDSSTDNSDSISASTGDSTVNETVEGLGLFYTLAGADEYTVDLADNGVVTFSVAGQTKVGTYTVAGNSITMTFDGETVKGTLKNGELTFTYQNAEWKFLEKVTYTITFNANGGSEVTSVSVLNGQSFTKPTDPTKDGYGFLGWYTDSNLTTPYSFAASVVRGDMTLYAAWETVDPNAAVYTIDFDLGYDGTAIADMTTVNGKLNDSDMPVPTRDGYTFRGWWISDTEKRDELTRPYAAGMTFNANTTLFAVWEENTTSDKLSAPMPYVDGNAIKWDGVSGAVRGYRVTVTGPVGFTELDKTVTTLSQAVDFAAAPAGDYTITVQAISQSGDEYNSDVATRIYKNRVLDRVSLFEVNGNVLSFNAVKNATNYYITVECGDADHKHTNYDNGTSTTFDFSSCAMKADGIKFTVTAAADTYAPSTSETFTVLRSLDKVTGVTLNDETQMLTWDKVDNAATYVLTVTCGDSTHEHTNVELDGSVTSYSLKECPGDGNNNITVSISPKTKGYNLPEATTMTFVKTTLPTPGGMTVTSVDGRYMLAWNPVEGATSYSVKLTAPDGTSKMETSATTSMDITDLFTWANGASYTIEIQAKSATTTSLWSDEHVVLYGVMNDDVTYKAGTFSWNATLGATAYKVRVNGGEPFMVTDGKTSAAITWTDAGASTVEVCAVMPTGDTDWVGMNVNTYKVTFDTRGGSAGSEVYLANGDKLTLPTDATKPGYTFAAWYTTMNGPADNGLKYEDGTFSSDRNITLYAYWTANTYTLTYDAMNGTLPAGTTVGSATYMQNYKWDVPTSNDSSNVFVGWFITNSAWDTAAQLTDARGNSLKPWDYAGDMTVYAGYINDALEFTKLIDGTYSVRKGRNVSKLTAITIPATYTDPTTGHTGAVTVVEGYAFVDRRNLYSVTIPDTVKIIEATAFSQCNNLEEVNIVHVDGTQSAGVYESHDGVLIYKNAFTGETELDYCPLGKMGVFEVPANVTEIPQNLFAGSRVTEVVIPASVRFIRAGAFNGCANLQTVTFVSGGMDTLTIENDAFKNCTSLAAIKFPARLGQLTIDTNTNSLTMFTGCSSLASIEIEAGNEYYYSMHGVLTDVDQTIIYHCPTGMKGDYRVPMGIEAIADYAFSGCTNLTSVTIPGWVETIGKNAFYGCSNITTITFEGNAGASAETKIGEGSFRNMSSLTSVVFEDGSKVTEIGAYAFADAANLTAFTIPSTVTYVGNNAFEDAIKLAEVNFAEGAELNFGNQVFLNCSGLTTINLPASLKTLNLGVFDGCVNIANIFVDDNNAYYEDVDGVVYSKKNSNNERALVFFPKGRKGDENGAYAIPDDVTEIADGAFAGTHYITTIEIGANVSKIGANAFAGSQRLEYFTFADSDVPLTIGDRAFENCLYVSFALPERVTSIGNYAFYNSGLSSVTFSDNLTSVGNYAFAKTTVKSVTFPATIASFGEYVFSECASLTTVDLTAYTGTSIPAGTFNNTAVKSITIPASVEEIGYGAFDNCRMLSSLTFEEGGSADKLVIGTGEKKEGIGVFINCASLTKVTLPARTTYIGNYAFSGCTTLATVGTEGTKIERIGDSAFEGCRQLTSFYVPNTVANSETLDTGVQDYAIGAYAFASSGLTTLTFQEGGTGDVSIGDYAFNGASNFKTLNLPANLASIYANVGGVKTYREGVCYETFSGSSISTLKIDASAENYATVDSVFYAKENGVPVTMLSMPTSLNTTVTIPKTVTKIAAHAAERSTVPEILFEDAENADGDPLFIDNYAFQYCSKMKTFQFPARLVEIGGSAFYNCTALTAVHLPANLEKIGNSAFRGSSVIVDLTFAEGCKLETISESAFLGCKKIKGEKFVTDNGDGTTTTTYKLIIPANVKTIETSAFNQCNAVTELGFEEGSKLTRIGTGAFTGMKLVTLALPDNLTTLDGKIVGSTMSTLKTIVLPKNLESIPMAQTSGPDNFFGSFSALENIVVPDDALNFSSVDGILYSKDGGTLVYCPSTKTFENNTFVFPEKVTAIGSYAFYNNKSIKYLTIPASVVSIGPWAFGKSSPNSALNTLEFAERENNLLIGESAFANNSGLLGTPKTNEDGNTSYQLYIPKEVYFGGVRESATGVFQNTDIRKVIFEEGNQSIDMRAMFKNCQSLSSVTGIPKTISRMVETFYKATSLATVTFEGVAEGEAGLITDMSGTFYGCTRITEVNLPNVNNLSIDNHSYATFEGCTKLTRVTMGDVMRVGRATFKGCTALTEVVMSNTTTEMGTDVFYNCKALTTVNIPAALTNIPENTFYNCSSLKNVKIPDNVTTIGTKAFYNCTALETLSMPEGLYSIGDYAFYGCSTAQMLNLPSTVEYIGEYAFYNWNKISILYIPSTMQNIGNYAFAGCSSLNNLVLMEGVVALADGVFMNCTSLRDVTLPTTMTSVGTDVFKGCTLDNLAVADGNESFIARDRILYNKAMTEMVYVPGSISGDVTIPDTITTLADGLFAGTAITSIALPNGLTSIGANAFKDCTDMVSITLPAALTSIGDGAFKNCTSLKSVDVPDGVETIGKEAFRNCESLESADLSAELLIIGDMAFENCSKLQSIEIPRKVRSMVNPGYESHPKDAFLSGYYFLDMSKEFADGIGYGAFANCTSLTSVTFEAGGVDRLSFGAYAFFNTGLTEITIPNRVRGAWFHKQQLFPDPGMLEGEFGIFGAIDMNDMHVELEQGIGMFCFARCYDLKTVTFEEDDKSKLTDNLIICIGAFAECSSLETVTFNKAIADSSVLIVRDPDSGKGETFNHNAVMARAFDGCTALRTVVVPASGNTVSYRSDSFPKGFGGFTGDGVKSVMVNDNVETFGEHVQTGQHDTGGGYTVDGCHFKGCSSGDCAFGVLANGVVRK